MSSIICKKTLSLIITAMIFVSIASAQVINVDVLQPGDTIHREVAGQFWKFYYAPNAATSLRGVAGGLVADTYDWQKLKGIYSMDWIHLPENATLGFLTTAKDKQAMPLMTVNMRGTGEFAPFSTFTYNCTYLYGCGSGSSGYPNLVTLATEWVTYVNQIVPNYTAGQILPASYQSIINKLVWTPNLPTDESKKTQPVQYWEIGNEPEVSISGYSGSSIETSSTFNYMWRYKQITDSMLTADPSIKVGPCITTIDNTPGNYWWPIHPVRSVINPQNNCKVDFIAYHPYDGLYLAYNSVPNMEQGLRNIKNFQETKLNDVKLAVREEYIKAGRTQQQAQVAADSLEYMCTEWNPINWGPYGSDTDPDKQTKYNNAMQSQYQALAVAETVFAYARLGIRSAYFWGWAGGYGGGSMPVGQYPSYMVFEKMMTYLGDELLYSLVDNNVRIYVMKDSRTGKLSVWGLNFSNSTDSSVTLNLTNVPQFMTARMHTLGHPSGQTLLTHNQTDGVAWKVDTLAVWDTTGYQMLLPKATIKLLVIEPLDCQLAKQEGFISTGDVNSDCEVDLLDFAVIASEWLECSKTNQNECL